MSFGAVRASRSRVSATSRCGGLGDLRLRSSARRFGQASPSSRSRADRVAGAVAPDAVELVDGRHQRVVVGIGEPDRVDRRGDFGLDALETLQHAHAAVEVDDRIADAELGVVRNRLQGVMVRYAAGAAAEQVDGRDDRDTRLLVDEAAVEIERQGQHGTRLRPCDGRPVRGDRRLEADRLSDAARQGAKILVASRKRDPAIRLQLALHESGEGLNRLGARGEGRHGARRRSVLAARLDADDVSPGEVVRPVAVAHVEAIRSWKRAAGLAGPESGAARIGVGDLLENPQTALFRLFVQDEGRVPEIVEDRLEDGRIPAAARACRPPAPRRVASARIQLPHGPRPL